MSNQVPDGWKELLVQDAFTLGRGRVISKPEINNAPGIYPVYSSQSMNEGKMGSINTYDFDGEYITWTTDGAYAGTVFYRNGKFNCTNVCGILKDNGKSKTYSRFVAYYLQTVAKNYVSYVGNPKLMNNTFGDIPFLLPPLPEQKKIASILTSVDDVIEKTEAQISKLQDLKKGMMTELLTKGIGHTEFKDSPVGRIPKSWDVKTLGEIAKIERGKFSHRPRNDPHFYNGDVPFIQTGDIPKEHIEITKYSQTLNRHGLEVSKLFPKGTLVITIAATIGEIGLLTFDACFPDSLVGITPNNKTDSLYVLYIMRNYKELLISFAPQTAQKNINLEILNPFLIPVPSLSEQTKIASSLHAVDKNILFNNIKLAQTKALKKALMNDLLIGKKRVL